MNATLDKYGRILIPKPLRDKLHWHEGDTFELEAGGGDLRVKPAKAKGGLVMEGSVLVWDGELDQDVDLVKFINDERDRRIEDLQRRLKG